MAEEPVDWKTHRRIRQKLGAVERAIRSPPPTDPSFYQAWKAWWEDLQLPWDDYLALLQEIGMEMPPAGDLRTRHETVRAHRAMAEEEYRRLSEDHRLSRRSATAQSDAGTSSAQWTTNEGWKGRRRMSDQTIGTGEPGPSRLDRVGSPPAEPRVRETLQHRDPPCQRCAKKGLRCVGRVKAGSPCARCRAAGAACSHTDKITLSPVAESEDTASPVPVSASAPKAKVTWKVKIPFRGMFRRRAKPAPPVEEPTPTTHLLPAEEPYPTGDPPPAEAEQPPPVREAFPSREPSSIMQPLPSARSPELMQSPALMQSPPTVQSPLASSATPTRRIGENGRERRRTLVKRPPLPREPAPVAREPKPGCLSRFTPFRRAKAGYASSTMRAETPTPGGVAMAPASGRRRRTTPSYVAPSMISERRARRASEASGRGKEREATPARGAARRANRVVGRAEDEAGVDWQGLSHDDMVRIREQIRALEEKARRTVDDISALRTYFPD
ncbi:hypothetical protein BV25DRAFT_1837272 [Artomyces pyxidatus]|uniref:Uncharacterized protein n=1 Tax=Artomyces pyxidatus TaxID=48021 RepID=A0ACB8T793_9AGAM|nr:hypothetical protein BV25DRAFT_1837272 [Artomyces pyxidatus]